MDTAVLDIVKELQQIRIDIQNNQRRLEETINDSLRCVDTLSHLLPEEFDLTTAVALCKAGYFVFHVDFNSRESIHYYDGIIYHEDGTTATVQALKEQNLLTNWRVKRNPLEIDLVKLRNLHYDAEDALFDGNFEDCFK